MIKGCHGARINGIEYMANADVDKGKAYAFTKKNTLSTDKKRRKKKLINQNQNQNQGPESRPQGKCVSWVLLLKGGETEGEGELGLLALGPLERGATTGAEGPHRLQLVRAGL